MALELAIEASPGETRLVRFEDGAPVETGIERDRLKGETRRGDLFAARLSARAPAGMGWFAELGEGPPGLLPAQGKARDLTEGARVWVRVARPGGNSKGPALRLSSRMDAGEPVPEPGLIEPGPSLVQHQIERAGAALAALWFEGPGAEAARWSAAAKARAPGLALHHGAEARARMDEAFSAALARRVAAPGAGRFTVARTEAGWMIDVDLGGVGAGTERTLALAAANLRAARAVGRHVRLANLSGLIVIDFAGDGRAGEAGKAARALREALAGDPAHGEVRDLKAFGLVALARARREPSLWEIVGEEGRDALQPGLRYSARSLGLSALRRAQRLSADRPGAEPIALADLVEADEGEDAAARARTWLDGEGAGLRAAFEARAARPLALEPKEPRQG